MRSNALKACLLTGLLIATAKSAEESQRVRPPEWSRDVLDAFFEDARDQLVGERPRGLARAKQVNGDAPLVAEPSSDELKWSRIVDADTLMAEVKRINNQLATALRKSATFQGGGNLTCRRDFGFLAVLFGVIAEFDEDIRWRNAANLMRSRCVRTSRNCKTASAQSFADAQGTQVVLDELLRGQAPAAANVDNTEDQLSDRTLLMQAMEVALQERLGPALSSGREFRRRSQSTAEQAQLLAVLAKVIQHDGYEYAADDDFLAEARRLREAATELSQAAKEKNYDAARKAAGRVGQSCSNCHEGYRG